MSGLLVAPAWADGFKSAGGSAGGAAAPERPRIDELRCAPGTAVCQRNELLSVLGSGMQGTDAVVFLGGRGTRDDRRARPRETEGEELTVKVPNGARTGRIKVIHRGVGTARSQEVLQVQAPAATPAPPAPNVAPAGVGAITPGVFPIQGAHTYGETRSNVFTGKGGHQGNDVFAACGTPLVASQPATVTRSAFQARAGNYVVLKGDDGRGFAYMHMREASLVKQGQRVVAGQPVGTVGETGRASGCHLHFELWTAPGWYEGGDPVDPRAQLKAWDTAG